MNNEIARPEIAKFLEEFSKHKTTIERDGLADSLNIKGSNWPRIYEHNIYMDRNSSGINLNNAEAVIVQRIFKSIDEREMAIEQAKKEKELEQIKYFDFNPLESKLKTFGQKIKNWFLSNLN